MGVCSRLVTASVSPAARRRVQPGAGAQARNASASKSLAVCKATNLTLTNALTVIETGGKAQASTANLTPDQLLARRAAGADACARAFEAEALVREAAR